MPFDSTVRIPLLRDRHNHPFFYAALMDGVYLGGPAGKDRGTAVSAVREAARSNPNGWTLAYGWNSGRYSLDESLFADLPAVAVINLSIHGLVLNDAARVEVRRIDPEVVDRLDDDHWMERNLRRVLNVFAYAGANPDRIRRYFDHLRTMRGVDQVEELLLVGEDEIRMIDAAGLSDRTRFWASPEVYDVLPADLRIRISGIKVFTDGAIGVRTAALHRPFRGSGGHGMLLYEDDAELRNLLDRYLSRGVPAAVHAIGDRAIDQVVRTAEELRPGAGGYLRMEHAQLISRSTADRAKRIGMHLCMQPNFSDDSVCYVDRLPDGYPEANNPFRMLIDDCGFTPGVDLYFGSDGMPPGVADGLRQSLFPPYPSQRLSLSEFQAGYCLPDLTRGSITVRIDSAARQLTCEVTPADQADGVVVGASSAR